jgi:hypothetical protein
MSQVYGNSLDALSSFGCMSDYAHPDFIHYFEEWVMIRDCIAGERRVKSKRTLYLPNLDSNMSTTYDDYICRAVFTNMTARTVMGLVGTIFRRNVKVENCARENLENVSLDGLDFNLFTKKMAYEVCGVGRIGVLVDMPKEGGKVYLTEYTAENIVSWRTQVIDGRTVPVYVLLREIKEQISQLGDGVQGGAEINRLVAQYRILTLKDGVYQQHIYHEEEKIEQNITGTYAVTELKFDETYTPTRNGVPLNFIPFKIFGPLSPTFDVQKSPVGDICSLNIAHYRTSAQLEHGRFYTALPIYYVPVAAGSEKPEYSIGPSTVWEVPQGEKPGILEYFGTGLNSLTLSLTEKEEHIAQLGGRIMGIRPQATAESDNIYKMKQANEMSILLNITESISQGMTEVLKWYLKWQRLPTEGVRVKLNQDFKQLNIAARELRAIALLYQSGILPVDEVFRTLQDAEFINDELTLEEFKALLDNTDNFPNQPDVDAMHEGYANASDRLKKDMQDDQQEHEKDLLDTEGGQASDLQGEGFAQADKTARFEAQQAIKLAKMKPKPAPAGAKPAAKPSGGAKK